MRIFGRWFDHPHKSPSNRAKCMFQCIVNKVNKVIKSQVWVRRLCNEQAAGTSCRGLGSKTPETSRSSTLSASCQVRTSFSQQSSNPHMPAAALCAPSWHEQTTCLPRPVSEPVVPAACLPPRMASSPLRNGCSSCTRRKLSGTPGLHTSPLPPTSLIGRTNF